MGLMLPVMGTVKARLDGVTAFAGYNHNLKIRDNEFYDMQNITSALLPVVAERPRRALLRTLAKPNGLFAHEKLCWVDGTEFYYGGQVKGQVTDCEKQFVRMGAYVLIWPDKAYYNTHTDEFGSLTAQVETAGTVTCQLCRPNGTVFEDYAIADTAPENPENGALWMDTKDDPDVLRQYNATTGMWAPVPTVYTMISAPGIGQEFADLDGVTLEGFDDDELNGKFYLIGRGDDHLIVTAFIREAFTQDTPVTAAREIPDMDFITENENRIWGCSSEKHEIYACELGDPKNWNAFLGLSTDSYAMTVGSGGRFTGACTHMGSVLFFKENVIHQLMGTKPANFQLDNTDSRGVGRGNERSLCIVNETLFYKSAGDVCAFGAALPVTISTPLGQVAYRNAVGGALDGCYYLCMEDAKGKHTLFTYNTQTGIWCKEDHVAVRWFATLDNELYFITDDGGLWSAPAVGAPAVGTPAVGEYAAGNSAAGAPAAGAPAVGEYAAGYPQLEAPVEWMLETGDMGLDEPYSKYITGIQIYAGTNLGTTICIALQYDGAGEWAEVFRQSFPLRKSVVIPLIPKRCRTLRIRMHGQGGFLLYSITKRTEAGSDVYGAVR